MKIPGRRGWLVPVLLASVVARSAADAALDGLAERSPFFPVATGPATAADVTLEFRGFCLEGSQQYFSVFDPGQNRGFWLRRDDAAEGLRVKDFDAAGQVLTVEMNGRAQTLLLKVSTVRSSPPQLPTVGTTAQGAIMVNKAGATAEVDTGSSAGLREAQEALARAQQLQAYEIRARRAAEKQRLTSAKRQTADTP